MSFPLSYCMTTHTHSHTHSHTHTYTQHTHTHTHTHIYTQHTHTRTHTHAHIHIHTTHTHSHTHTTHTHTVRSCHWYREIPSRGAVPRCPHIGNIRRTTPRETTQCHCHVPSRYEPISDGMNQLGTPTKYGSLVSKLVCVCVCLCVCVCV